MKEADFKAQEGIFLPDRSDTYTIRIGSDKLSRNFCMKISKRLASVLQGKYRSTVLIEVFDRFDWLLL